MDNEQIYLKDSSIIDIDNLDLIEEDFRVNEEDACLENSSAKFEYLNKETAKNKVDEYECEYFSPECDLNLSKDFQLHFAPQNNLDAKITPDKFQFPNNDEDFSDLSSISDIDNANLPKNKHINFDNDDEIKINLRMNNHEDRCTFNLEEDMSLNLIEQNEDCKNQYLPCDGEIKINIEGIKAPVKKPKRQKADLDKTPLPIFDCIYCSNEVVVFCHMIREKLSEKYLLGATERDIAQLNAILSNSNSNLIGINTSIDLEAQHMRNFIIYHTEYLNKIYDKKAIHKFFESLSLTLAVKAESYTPILKKKIPSNFDNTLQTVNKNTLSLLNRLKSHRADAIDLSKNMMNSAMSPNFSNSNFNSNSMHTNTMYNYNSNFNTGEEVLYRKFEKTSLTEGIMEEKFEGELEREEEQDQEPSNFDKNESFLKFLRFDLKRKINFEDITWEEESYDIWDPNLSITQTNSVDSKEKSPALLKILNNFYKNQNSEDFLLEDSNDSNFIHVEVNDLHTSDEMAIDMENLISSNKEPNYDKNKIEASSYSINPMISNFFENSYNKNKNKFVREKEKSSDAIFNKYKSPSKENKNHPLRNFSSRINNHMQNLNHANSNKHVVLSPKSLRLDSLESLCNKSQSLFNSMSHQKTVNQSAKKNNFEKINSIENISMNGEELFDLNEDKYENINPRRLKTEYKIKKDNFFSDKKTYLDTSKCFNSMNFLSSSSKNCFTPSNHYDRNKIILKQRSNSKENLFFREKFKSSKLNSTRNLLINSLTTPVDKLKLKCKEEKNSYARKDSKNSLIDLISVFRKKFRNTENTNSTATSNPNGKSTLNNSRTWMKMSAKDSIGSKINFENFNLGENYSMKNTSGFGYENSSNLFSPHEKNFNSEKKLTVTATSNLDKVKSMIKDYGKRTDENLFSNFSKNYFKKENEIYGKKNYENKNHNNFINVLKECDRNGKVNLFSKMK